MENNIDEPLLQRKPTSFGFSPQQLIDICNYENRKLDPQNPNTFVSSGLIMSHGGNERIAQGLKSNLKVGITGDLGDIRQRKIDYGANAFPPPVIKSLGEIIMENFDDPINRVLIAAAIVSAITGLIQDGFPKGLVDGVSILIALLIIIVVGSSNNYASELKLAE